MLNIISNILFLRFSTETVSGEEKANKIKLKKLKVE